MKAGERKSRWTGDEFSACPWPRRIQLSGYGGKVRQQVLAEEERFRIVWVVAVKLGGVVVRDSAYSMRMKGKKVDRNVGGAGETDSDMLACKAPNNII